MRVFVLALDSDGADVASAVKMRLEKEKFQIYELSPSVFVVASDRISNDIAMAAGIKGSSRIDGASGVVFRMDGYSGYTDRSLWEWIEKAED